MIIIEGPDGAGKTTLVQYIKAKNGHAVVKPYYPKKNQLSYYLHSGALYKGYFLERYYLSEVVYPRFKLNREPMEDWKQHQIEASLLHYAPVIFYLRPDRETIIKNINTRGDDYISEDEVDRMLVEYDAAIERSHIPIVRYDYTKDDVEAKLQEAIDIHVENNESAEYMHQWLSSGNTLYEEGIMFVGEDPSDKSVGEGFIRAFMSDKGSSAFLHQSLTKAGVYENEMPYFTNWGKGFDNDEDKLDALKQEIDMVKPRVVICLGKEIRDKAQQEVWIEHPSYVKRFHSKDHEWYINKIKELVNED
jgi:thymidylate kinase